MRELRATDRAVSSKRLAGVASRIRAPVIRPSASVVTSSFTCPEIACSQAAAGSGAAASNVEAGSCG